MKHPLFCKDCVWAELSDTNAFCTHPKVVKTDSVILAKNPKGAENADLIGTSCLRERDNRSWFAPCGIRGKLWSPRTPSDRL
jgi:hypothetical protein